MKHIKYLIIELSRHFYNVLQEEELFNPGDDPQDIINYLCWVIRKEMIDQKIPSPYLISFSELFAEITANPDRVEDHYKSVTDFIKKF